MLDDGMGTNYHLSMALGRAEQREAALKARVAELEGTDAQKTIRDARGAAQELSLAIARLNTWILAMLVLWFAAICAYGFGVHDLAQDATLLSTIPAVMLAIRVGKISGAYLPTLLRAFPDVRPDASSTATKNAE